MTASTASLCPSNVWRHALVFISHNFNVLQRRDRFKYISFSVIFKWWWVLDDVQAASQEQRKHNEDLAKRTSLTLSGWCKLLRAVSACRKFSRGQRLLQVSRACRLLQIFPRLLLVSGSRACLKFPRLPLDESFYHAYCLLQVSPACRLLQVSRPYRLLQISLCMHLKVCCICRTTQTLLHHLPVALLVPSPPKMSIYTLVCRN